MLVLRVVCGAAVAILVAVVLVFQALLSRPMSCEGARAVLRAAQDEWQHLPPAVGPDYDRQSVQVGYWHAVSNVNAACR